MIKCTCVFLILLLSACSSPSLIHKYTFFAFGTIIELTISGADKSLADQAAERVQADFERMHHDWHAWQGDEAGQPSALMRLNERLAKGLSVQVDNDMVPMLIRAQELAANSSLTFNPGLGGLLKIWGYQSDEQPTSPPGEEMLKAFLQQVPGPSDYVLEGGRLSSQNTSLQFDLGGFAKGYGIENVMQHLQDMGIENAILNAGGDLKVIGMRHDRRWRVGIRHPRKAGVLAWIDVEPQESVFTSGDYERFFYYNGHRYHHILDPRTGYPANQTISVTVVNNNASLADAAATALFVAGPDDWQKVASQMGVDQVMLVDSGGQFHFTPALRERIQLTEEKLELEEYLTGGAEER